MRVLTLLLSAWCLCSSVFAADKTPEDQPPQILGVWYGTYTAPDSGKQAEMWLGIFFQLSVDGYDVRGHNRWNFVSGEEALHGADSGGSMAGHFDTVSGRIADDHRSVSFVEGSRKGRIEARLTGADTMEAQFFPVGQTAASFHVELTRVNTHYDPDSVHVLGVDVSHHSGAVDWQKVRSEGYRFAYIKASEGVDNPDAMFETHWKALRELDMPRGAYHFYVTEDDPVEQARFFASRLKDDPGTLPPAVDVEVLGHHTDGDMTATLMRFLVEFERVSGLRPAVYTMSSFWDRYYRPEFSDYPLWMAEHGVIMPKVPFGWKNWLLWQHALDRQVGGVEKTADVSILHPDVDLRRLQQDVRRTRP